MKVAFLLILSLFTLFATSWGQNEFRKREEWNGRKDRINSESQIKQLREGVLLIRLRTKQPLVDALRSREMNQEADQVIAMNLLKNKEIIQMFKLWFDFCPTYFFYSEDSDYIRNMQLDSVGFLNDSAIVDPKIYPRKDSFFIAEFSKLKPDTATFSEGRYTYRGENGLERREMLSGGGTFGFEALIFKSPQFYQLRRPFPYYARTLGSLPLIRRSFRHVIRMANENLHYYYKKVTHQP